MAVATLVNRNTNPYGTWNGYVFVGMTSRTIKGTKVSIGDRRTFYVEVDDPSHVEQITAEVVAFVPTEVAKPRSAPLPKLRVIKSESDSLDMYAGKLLSNVLSESVFNI
jgi:hypothetical protein